MDNTHPLPTLPTHLCVYKVACQILERFECECIHGHADCIAYAAELKEERDLRPLHDDGHAAKAAAVATAAAAANAAAAAAAAANAAVAAAADAAAAVMLMSLGHVGALICSGNGSSLVSPGALRVGCAGIQGEECGAAATISQYKFRCGVANAKDEITLHCFSLLRLLLLLLCPCCFSSLFSLFLSSSSHWTFNASSAVGYGFR